MRKTISTIKLSDTLQLSECHDGFWLYDKTRGMNLSMQAHTPTDAFVQALTYYQRRLVEIEQAHITLHQKVDHFVSQVAEASHDD